MQVSHKIFILRPALGDRVRQEWTVGMDGDILRSHSCEAILDETGDNRVGRAPVVLSNPFPAPNRCDVMVLRTGGWQQP